MTIITKPVRTCATCSKCKLNEQFHRDRRGALTFECKQCHTERLRPFYAGLAIERRAKECKRLGLPVDASDSDMHARRSERERAHMTAAAKRAQANAHLFKATARVDLSYHPRDSDEDKERYRAAKLQQQAADLLDSELAAAHGMTDEEITELPDDERDYKRDLRDLAAALASMAEGVRQHSEWMKTPAGQAEQTLRDAERDREETERARKRADQRTSRAKQDPRKARLSAVKTNLRKVLKTAEKLATRRAWLTGLTGDDLYRHGGAGYVSNSLGDLDREEYLNQQAQAKWWAEIEALEGQVP